MDVQTVAKFSFLHRSFNTIFLHGFFTQFFYTDFLHRSFNTDGCWTSLHFLNGWHEHIFQTKLDLTLKLAWYVKHVFSHFFEEYFCADVSMRSVTFCNPGSRTSLHQRSDGNVIPDQTFYQQNLSFQKKSLNLFKEMQYFDNSPERNILISFPWKNLGFSFCSHFCCFPSKVLELLFFGNCTKWVSEKMFWNPSRTYLTILFQHKVNMFPVTESLNVRCKPVKYIHIKQIFHDEILFFLKLILSFHTCWWKGA